MAVFGWLKISRGISLALNMLASISDLGYFCSSNLFFSSLKHFSFTFSFPAMVHILLARENSIFVKNLWNRIYLLLNRPTLHCFLFITLLVSNYLSDWDLILAICVNINSGTIFMILWILYVFVALSLKQLSATFCAAVFSLPLVWLLWMILI